MPEAGVAKKRGPGRQRGNAFAAWMLTSQRPMGGRLRFLFYIATLLLFALLNEPWRWPRTLDSRGSFAPIGVMEASDFPFLSGGALWALLAVTLVGWICAGVGYRTRLAKWVTAISFLLLLGYQLSFSPLGDHSHYLLLYAFFCLSLSTSDSDFSVDAWLARRRGQAESAPRDGLGASGFPRQLLLLFAVAIYFSAGVSKLADGGLRWLDGHSLQYYISTQSSALPFIAELRDSVVEMPNLCMIFAVGSILLELSSPLALFSRRLRHLYVVGWVGMHMGILILMKPDYWIHSFVVVTLLTDWAWLGDQIPEPLRGVLSPLRRLCGWISAGRESVADFSATAAASLSGAALIGSLLAVAAIQIEWYPVSHVPMYGSYFGRGILAGVPEADLADEDRVLDMARSCSGNRTFGFTRRCSWNLPVVLSSKMVLRVSRGDEAPVRHEGRLSPVRWPAIEQLAGMRDETASVSGPERRGRRLSRSIRTLARSQGRLRRGGFDRFELVYPLADREILLMSGPL
jgi:hypothetical protein